RREPPVRVEHHAPGHQARCLSTALRLRLYRHLRAAPARQYGRAGSQGTGRLSLRVVDEVAHAREDHFPPAPPREDPIVPHAGGDVVHAPLARNVEAELMRGLGLAVSRNVIELAFDGE